MTTAPDTIDAATLALPRVPVVQERVMSGRDLEASEGASFMGSRDVKPAVREAILAALYEERTGLTRKRRLEGLSPDEAARLTETEAYIDDWELGEEDSAASDVWARINAIATRVVGISASIERQRR